MVPGLPAERKEEDSEGVGIYDFVQEVQDV